MTLHIDIPPQLEEQLRLQAELSGKSQADLVLDAIAEKYKNTAKKPTAENIARAEEVRRVLQEIRDLRPPVTHFVDDSRESIYEGCGE